MDSYHCGKSSQKDKKRQKTSDTSKEHQRIPTELATHCFLKTHGCSQKILLPETQRSLERVHPGMHSVWYITTGSGGAEIMQTVSDCSGT